MEEILFIELTKAQSDSKVLVCLPFDIAEARSDCTYLRTKGGADLYVTESLEEIKRLMQMLAEYAANPPLSWERADTPHQHRVVRRADGTEGSCCQ